MGTTSLPRSVRPVAGLLCASVEGLSRARAALEAELGPVASVSDPIPFPRPAYYAPTMGQPLVREFVSFQAHVDPVWLGPFKHRTNALEREMAVGAVVARPLNIDPGYVGPGKLVLATGKDRAHRIYLGNGIYAEVTLIVQGGRFRPLRWTYTDYRCEQALAFFDDVRCAHLSEG